jgi:hypothetical protein
MLVLTPAQRQVTAGSNGRDRLASRENDADGTDKIIDGEPPSGESTDAYLSIPSPNHSLPSGFDRIAIERF